MNTQHDADSVSSRSRSLVPFVVLTLLPSIAMAQSVHEHDYLVRLHEGSLQVGGLDHDTGEITFPQPLNEGVFGEAGVPNFTDEPGINSEPGALTPDLGLGFDLLGPLLVWSGSAFESVATETMTVTDGFDSAQTPATDSTVPGFLFGFAGADAAAVFHSHLPLRLDTASPTPPDGVWLLRWRLWADDPSIAPSDTLYTVFAQGTGEAALETAVEWVEQEWLTPPCPADLNGDSIVDQGDIQTFIAFFLASDAAADLNSDAVVDQGDIQTFVAAFLAGC